MPQTATPVPSIHFGTDGWRGVIAEDFTFASVRLVACAIARYSLAHENFQDRKSVV